MIHPNSFDFSIIIPSYNQGIFLSDCLSSIVEARGQSCSAEIIVVDSNSTDSTPQVLDYWHEYIDILIVEDDTGQTNAINKGFRASRGRFVNWIGCDDRLTPLSLSHVKDVLESDASISVVSGYADIFRDGIYSCTQRSFKLSPSPEILFAFPRIVQPSTFWRRPIFEQLYPLNEALDYVMDLDLWLRFIVKYGDNSLFFSNAILAQVQLHSDCKSVRDSHLFESEILGCIRSSIDNVSHSSHIFKEVQDYRKIHNLLQDVKTFHFDKTISSSMPTIWSWIKYISFVRNEVLSLVRESQYKRSFP